MYELTQKALRVRDLYKELNQLKGENKWTYREFTEGLVGDVGDLTKMFMAKAGFRSYKGNLDEDIKHELSDCLWAVIVISDELGIDLEESFNTSIDSLGKKVEEKIKELK